jgi:hypothetical protein
MSLADGRVMAIFADDFARRFSLRASNLMWLLGAGASAAAGIPTAYELIWDFKQRLFISQRRVSPKAVADLASPAIRARIQGTSIRWARCLNLMLQRSTASRMPDACDGG